MGYQFVFNPITSALDMVGVSASILSNYFYLPGVAGGQIANGGLNAGDNLTLHSTANATKGFILLGSASAYDETNIRLGLNQTSPQQTLDITGIIMSRGVVGSGEILNISGLGSRMFFYPAKAAFRAGALTFQSTYWDDANIGQFSIGLGEDVKAAGIDAIAIGLQINIPATGGGAIGIGNTISFSNFGYAFGNSLTLNDGASILIGVGITTNGGGNLVVGKLSYVNSGDGGANVLFGFSNTTLSTVGGAILFGVWNNNTFDFGVILGSYNTLTQPVGGVTIGSILIGTGLTWDTDGYVVLGSNAQTMIVADNSIFTGGAVGIGLAAVADLTDQFVVAGNIKSKTGYKSSDGSSGVTATITTAKLTTLGSNGSMTFKNGLLTAHTDAT